MSTDAPEAACPSCAGPVAGGVDDCPHCGEDLIAAGRERVRARFRRTKTLLTLALVGGFLLLTLGKRVPEWLGIADAKGTGALVRVAGTVIMTLVGVFYARMKGRSGWWGLIGLLGCIGYLVFLYLDKICVRCGTRSKDKVEECPTCRAPI